MNSLLESPKLCLGVLLVYSMLKIKSFSSVLLLRFLVLNENVESFLIPNLNVEPPKKQFISCEKSNHNAIH